MNAGLKRGQSLMAKAAATYRAGKYPNMAAALKGVSGTGGRRSNPKKFYNVYLGTEHIGAVSRSGEPSAEEVRRSLIEREGYDPEIRVVKGAKPYPRLVRRSSPGEEEYYAQRFENPSDWALAYEGRLRDLTGESDGLIRVEMNGKRNRRGGSAAQAAGLKRGQSLMKRAAAAYRSGKYPTMQAALKGESRKG